MVVGCFVSTLPAPFRNPAYSFLPCNMLKLCWQPAAVGGEISRAFAVKEAANIWVWKEKSQQACCSYIFRKKKSFVSYFSGF